jgi:hypothetical protein
MKLLKILLLIPMLLLWLIGTVMVIVSYPLDWVERGAFDIFEWLDSIGRAQRKGRP